MDIEAELQEATGIKQKKGEKSQTYLYRLTNAISELNDEDWASLSEAAQEWTNEAIESISNKEVVADFSVAAEEPEEEPAEEPEEEPAEESEVVDEVNEEELEEESELDEEQPPEEEEEDVIEEPEIETAEEDEEEMLTADTRINGRNKPSIKKAAKGKVAARNKLTKPVAKPVVKTTIKPIIGRPVAKPIAKVAEKLTKTVPAAPKRQTSANELVRQLVTKNPKITKEQLIQKVKDAGHDHLREGTIISWRYVILQIIRTQTALGLLKNS